jgi:hypothetical protein
MQTNTNPNRTGTYSLKDKYCAPVNLETIIVEKD